MHNTPGPLIGLTSAASRRGPPSTDVRRPNMRYLATDDQLFGSSNLNRRSSSRPLIHNLPLRGIQDEPAPPVLLNAASGTLGMPENERRAAFDDRLFMLSGVSIANTLPRDCVG